MSTESDVTRLNLEFDCKSKTSNSKYYDLTSINHIKYKFKNGLMSIRIPQASKTGNGLIESVTAYVRFTPKQPRTYSLQGDTDYSRPIINFLQIYKTKSPFGRGVTSSQLLDINRNIILPMKRKYVKLVNAYKENLVPYTSFDKNNDTFWSLDIIEHCKQPFYSVDPDQSSKLRAWDGLLFLKKTLKGHWFIEMNDSPHFRVSEPYFIMHEKKDPEQDLALNVYNEVIKSGYLHYTKEFDGRIRKLIEYQQKRYFANKTMELETYAVVVDTATNNVKFLGGIAWNWTSNIQQQESIVNVHQINYFSEHLKECVRNWNESQNSRYYKIQLEQEEEYDSQEYDNLFNDVENNLDGIENSRVNAKGQLLYQRK